MDIHAYRHQKTRALIPSHFELLTASKAMASAVAPALHHGACFSNIKDLSVARLASVWAQVGAGLLV